MKTTALYERALIVSASVIIATFVIHFIIRFLAA